MIHSILFPTSCQAADTKAFEYTLAVAKKFEARVEVLYVCELDVGVMVPGILRYQLAQEQKKSAQLVLKNWLKAFDFDGVLVNGQVELGFPKETIAIFANKRKEIELIAMGSADNHGFAKMIRGTVISKTIENVHCPVLIIPKGIVFQSIKNMAYVTPVVEDWRPSYPQLEAIAEKFEAQLYVTHLQEAPSEEFKGAEHVVLENYVGALHSFVYNANLHLLVTLASVRSTIRKILQYSKAQKMAFETLIPLLVLKKRKQ
jgi:nucleotide-binding universal stress UspA family protein